MKFITSYLNPFTPTSKKKIKTTWGSIKPKVDIFPLIYLFSIYALVYILPYGEKLIGISWFNWMRSEYGPLEWTQFFLYLSAGLYAIFALKKRVKDGLKYLLDDNGNVVKDSLGNDMKVDNIVTVRAKTIEFRQTKVAKIIAQVQIVNLKTNELVDKFPLSSEFIFENFFIEFSGDRRALNTKQKRFLKNKFLPFPSNEFLTYNNSNSIKSKLKYIVSNYTFSE